MEDRGKTWHKQQQPRQRFLVTNKSVFQSRKVVYLRVSSLPRWHDECQHRWRHGDSIELVVFASLCASFTRYPHQLRWTWSQWSADLLSIDNDDDGASKSGALLSLWLIVARCASVVPDLVRASKLTASRQSKCQRTINYHSHCYCSLSHCTVSTCHSLWKWPICLHLWRGHVTIRSRLWMHGTCRRAAHSLTCSPTRRIVALASHTSTLTRWERGKWSTNFNSISQPTDQLMPSVLWCVQG